MRSDRGQATAEFALVLPVCVLALLALIQVALVLRASVLTQEAARAAVRVASVDPDRAHAVRAAHRIVANADVTVVRGPRGEPVVVTVRSRYVTNLPIVGVLFPDPQLHARSEMRAEQ